MADCLKEKERLGGAVDLEAIEFHIRASMHEMGRLLLERLLNADGAGYRGSSIRCDLDHCCKFVEQREKEVLTVLGPVRIERSYYYDKKCKRGTCPRDAELDIESTSFSPGVRRMMARVGALRPFAQGQEDIQELAGLELTAKDIERISHHLGQKVEEFSRHSSTKIIVRERVETLYICMDGTGVPMVSRELLGRKGKGDDGRARTREAKLGCVFTQTTVDEKGFPLRDECSTSYIGAIESAGEFAQRIVIEADRRGVKTARRVYVIGDGAEWIWNLAQEHLPSAGQIVDLYHAREYYWGVARAFYTTRPERLLAWTQARRQELDRGDVESVIRAIKRLRPCGSNELQKLCDAAIGYYVHNIHRMRYAYFRQKGLFVGSGVLEAGCRTVIGQRLKLSGMHWTLQGSNAIIALRCCLLSGRWEDFWAYQVAA